MKYKLNIINETPVIIHKETNTIRAFKDNKGWCIDPEKCKLFTILLQKGA